MFCILMIIGHRFTSFHVVLFELADTGTTNVIILYYLLIFSIILGNVKKRNML